MDAATLYALLSIVVLFLALKFLFQNHHKNQPPSPPSIPFLGHVLYLKNPLHRTFQALSQKYGPIFLLRVGSRRILIVSSPSMAQECLGKNDIVFANRPRMLNSHHVAYNNTTIGTAPYGQHWREIRRVAVVEVLSSQLLEVFQGVRQDEVRRMVVQLARDSRDARDGFVRVDVKKIVSKMVLNYIMRVVAGMRPYDDNPETEEASRKFHDIMQDVLDKSSPGNPADYFPILTWISNTYVQRVKELGSRMDEFMQSLVDRQRQRKTDKGNTVVAQLLALQESHPDKYDDTIVKGLIQAILLAGTDTSIIAVVWAMSNLLNHPHILEKAREEIDAKIGQNRLIDSSDLPNLPYLQSIVSENFRLYPPGPFLLPHCSSADCTVGGYRVPRNTILLVNSWAIQRDPKVWTDPDSFKPERFEGLDQVDVFKLMPFGMGRRACPGATLGQRTVTFILGALIQCFDWKKINDEEIDMTEGMGLAMHKAAPLTAMCKARLVADKLLLEREA